jgi:integrase
MGQKNQKGTVTVSNADQRTRLRWRYQGKRYSLSLGQYDKINLKSAKKVVLQIELDIANDQFDHTLVRYGGKVIIVHEEPVIHLSIVACFEKWVKDFKQLDCDKNSDYHHLRNTLRKWGEINPDTMLHKLNTENYCPKTYNQRLSLLNSFSSWMLKQGFWSICKSSA